MSITLELPKDLSEIYTQFAKENHTTKEVLMQEALKAFVEDLEDLKIALKGREDRLKGEVGVEANALYQSLGL